MRAVDRRSPVPLWAQVLEDLRERLEGGEFEERFPTDHDLISEYGVSRHTVRDAVRRLHEAGMVERERGRGTFVRAPRIEQPLGALYSLFRSIEDQGYEQRSEVHALDERADAGAASALGLPADEPLVYLERTRAADHQPVAVDRSWLPASVARPLLDVDFTRTALYLELAERCGVTMRAGWERIQPALASPTQRTRLRIPARQAVFSIERLASDGTRPIEWRYTVVRGDRFAFVARWSGGDEVAATALEPAPEG